MGSISKSPDDLLAEIQSLREENSHLHSKLANIPSSGKFDSEATLNAFIETAVDAVITSDVDGTILSFNWSATNMFGYSKTEAIGKPVQILMSGIDSSHHDQYVSNYLHTGVKKIIGIGRDTYGKRADGKSFPIHLSISEINHQSQIQFIAVIRDITEQKETERILEDRVEDRAEELALLNNQMNTVTTNLPGILFQLQTDEEGHRGFTYVNPAVQKMLGISPQTLLNDRRAMSKLIHPDDRSSFTETFLQSGKTRTPWQWEGRFLGETGDIRWFEGTAELTVLPDNLIQWDGLFLDITNRKADENRRYESEEKYKSLSRAAFEGIATTVDGKILEVNETFSRLFGYDEGEVIGMSPLKLAHPADHQAIIDHISEQDETPYEIVAIRKDGSDFIAEIRGASRPYKGDTARTTAIRDVTARRLAENKLIESEQRFRSLSTAAFEGIVTLVDGIVVDANEEFRRMFGYTQSELIGIDGVYLTHPDDRSRVWEGRTKGKYNASYEATALCKDGSTFPYEAHGTTMPFEGKEARIVAVRDISERKAAETALRASNQKASLHIEHSPLSYIEWDMNFCVVDWNKAATDMFGYSKQEAMGQHASDLILTPKVIEIVSDVWKNLLSSTGGSYSRNDNMTKDGTIITCEWFNTQLTDDNGEVTGVASLTQDITLRTQLEEESLRSQKLESVGTLAGGLAHDFNNFLAMIMLNVGSAKMQSGLTQDTLERLTAAEQSITQAKAITNQLLSFTRGGDPVKSPAMIQPLITESVEFALHGMSHTISLELPDNLWVVEIDSGQINQVINNLILNACQAMPNGGHITARGENIVVSDRSPIGVLEAGNYVKVEIEDNGPGMSPRIVEKIFDPYFTTRDSGTGLGLFSCYTILERHTGWITASSHAGKGSLFTFYLPTSFNEAEENEEIIPQKGTGRILVMDDEEAILKGLSLSLEALGYTVTVTRDGAEVVQAYVEAYNNNSPFDVTILDLTVPGGMSGADAMERLIEIDPQVRAIVSSGYSTNPIMSKFENYGFKGALPKPYTIDNLSDILARVIKY